MSSEDLYIKNINNAIRGIKLGTKKPEDIGSVIAFNFKKLKEVNDGMYIDLMNDYKAVLVEYKAKQK